MPADSISMTGGVLYEVVIDVAPEARAAYLEWLRPHMAEMLNFDGFLSAALYQDAEDDCLLTCQYRLESRQALNAYLAGPAASMRADGLRRFADKMKARRRVLLQL